MELIVKVIVSFGSADHEGMTVRRGEHGLDNLRPAFRLGIGPLIADKEIQAGAAQIVVIIQANDAERVPCNHRN